MYLLISISIYSLNLNMLDPFKVLEISENKIIAKHNCSVTVEFNDYDNDSIVNSPTQIYLPGILDCFFPEFDDIAIIGLNYGVFLQKKLDADETDKYITIDYQPGDLILTQDYIKTGMDMRFLMRLLHGGISYISDPAIILNVLHNSFQDSELVHLEVVISNMMRDKDDPSTLARYKTSNKNNVVMGVIKQAQTDSILSAMAFRNIDKAIERALVSGKESKNNPIEKILQEDFTP